MLVTPVTESPTRQACPGCGEDDLIEVTAGGQQNHVCPACATCWHIEPGSVGRVRPATCGGCRLAGWCRAAQFTLGR